VPVKVKSSQTFPNETKSKALRAASVKGLKKLSNQVLYKRNSKSSGLYALESSSLSSGTIDNKGFQWFSLEAFLV